MKYHLAETESKFADIIWENEPIASPALVKLCEEQLSWKKSTTYTVLKKLCDRGIFQNVKTIVTSLITREEFYCEQSRQYVEESFSGSLPRFLTAFFGDKKLSKKEIKELQDYINEHTKEDTL